MTVSNQLFRPEVIRKICWRRKWHIVLPALVIAVSAFWWIQRMPDRYRSEALLLVIPQRVPDTFVRSTVTTRADHRLQSMTQQILSRTELERIIREFDLYAGDRKTDPMEDIVDSMRTRDIEIRPIKGDAFRLGFSSENPEVAMRVVDRLVSLFIVQASLDRTTLAEGTDQFLEAQLEDIRRKLVDNEGQQEAYRRRHNGELPRQLEANVQGLHNTQMQMQVIVDSLNRDRDRQLTVERSLKEASFDDLIETSTSAAPADATKLTSAERLKRAEASLKDMQATLTELHPDIVSMKQTIAELRKHADADNARGVESAEATAAARLRRSRLEGLRAELSAVERQIAQKTGEAERLRGVLLDYQRRIEAAPGREAELAALTRDYDTLQQTYRTLLAKKQESAMAASLERQQIGAQFKVLDPARLPEEPFAPKRTRLYTVAALGAFGIGLMLAVILEWFDRGMRTQDDVRAALGLPVLAVIPHVSTRRRGIRRAAVASISTAIVASVAALAWRFLK